MLGCEKLIKILCIGLLGLAVGCGSGKEDNEETWEKKEQDPEDSTSSRPGASVGSGSTTLPTSGSGDASTDPSELTGSWSSTCLLDTQANESLAISLVVRRKTEQWAEATRFFRDKECKDPYATKSYFGKLVIGEKDDELYPLQRRTTEIKLVLHKEDLKDSFNEKGLFGYDDWQVNKAKELMGRTDPSGTKVEVYSTHNYFKVEDNKLYLSLTSSSIQEASKELLPYQLYRQ